MKVEILYVQGCEGYPAVLDLVHQALAETGIDAEVEAIEIEAEAHARAYRFLGSPTVRVNELDVEPYASFRRSGFGLSCRTYEEGGQSPPHPSYRALKDTLEMGLLVEEGVFQGCISHWKSAPTRRGRPPTHSENRTGLGGTRAGRSEADSR